MSVIASRHDLTGARGVEKGREFSRSFACKNAAGAAIDLTGYVVTAEARATERKDSALIITFDVSHTDALGVVTLTYDDYTSPSIKRDSGFYRVVFTAPGGKPDTWIFGDIDFPG